jgi:O-antigen/teichoic acid export membrane protein
MSVGKKVALNSLAQIFGKAISVVIGLVTLKVLTNILGVSEFGNYTLIITYLTFFSILADLGLNVVLTTEISSEEGDIPTKVGNILSLRIFTATIVIGFLGGLVALFSPYPTQVKHLIGIGAIGMIAVSVSQVLSGVFQKYLHTYVIAIGDIISRAVLLVTVGFLYLQGNITLTGVTLGFILAGLLQTLYILHQTKRFVPITFGVDISYWKHLLRESLPLFIIIAFNLVYYKIDTIMLSFFKGAEDVGLYGVAYKVLELLLVFPGMFVGILLPLFTKYWKKDEQVFQQIVNKSLNTMIAIGIPVVFGGVLLAPRIVEFIASQEYLEATNSLRLLFGAFGFALFSYLMSHVLIGSGQKHRIVIIAIAGAATNILFNLILIPRLSYTGAALATMMTEGIVLLLYIIQVYRFVKVDFVVFWDMLLRVVLASLAMVLIILITNWMPLVITSLLASSVFAGAIWITSGYQRLKSAYLINIQEES